MRPIRNGRQVKIPKGYGADVGVVRGINEDGSYAIALGDINIHLPRGDIKELPDKLLKRHFERMNLPRPYWYLKGDLLDKGCRDKVYKYVRNIHEAVDNHLNLLIHGTPGAGKTTVAAGILKTAAAFGYTGYFDCLSGIRDDIKKNVSFDPEQSVLERLKTVDVLVIDNVELSAFDKFAFPKGRLTEIIRARLLHDRVTLITTPMSLEDFYSDFEEFRTSFGSSFIRLGITGPDLRAKKMADAWENLDGN